MLNFIMHMYFELFGSRERRIEINYMLPHVAQRPDISKLGNLVTLSEFRVSLVLGRPTVFHRLRRSTAPLGDACLLSTSGELNSY